MMTQKLLIKLVSLLAVISIVACAKEKTNEELMKAGSVDAQGFCTYSLIRNYNEVIYKTVNLKAVVDSADKTDKSISDSALALSVACGVFTENHSGVTCKARPAFSTTIVSQEISAEQLVPNCTAAKNVIKEKIAGKPAPSNPLNGTESLTLIDSAR